MYNEYIANMSEYEIENQVDQILNYSPNFLSDNKYGVMFMLSLYSNILKEYTTPKDSIPKFSYSIDDSIECISFPELYLSYIKNLISNNKNSFILAPLVSNNHLFTCLIHKVNNNYECTIINKGASVKNYSYKKYTIPEKSINNIIPILGLPYDTYLSISSIYSKFLEASSSCVDLVNVFSQPQKTNNCYYKEFEAGLKYAYSYAFIDNFTTPKWPISTLEMHQKYLSFVLSCDISDHSKNHIKTQYTVYTANKTFRSLLKLNKGKKEHSNNNLLSKIISPNTKSAELPNLEDFKSAFGFDDTKQSTFMALYHCLSLVDLGTLKQNFNFFKDVCKYYKLDEHVLALDVLKNYMYGKSVGLDKISSHLETFFPYVTRELKLDYSNFFNKLGNKNMDKNNLDISLRCFEKALALNPNDTSSLLDMGIVYHNKDNYNAAIDCFSKGLKLTPDSEIYIEKIALCHISLGDAKNLMNDYVKLSKINPNNPNLLYFKENYADILKGKNKSKKTSFTIT